MEVKVEHLRILVAEFQQFDGGKDFLLYTLSFHGVSKLTELGSKLEEVFLFLSDVLHNLKEMKNGNKNK